MSSLFADLALGLVNVGLAAAEANEAHLANKGPPSSFPEKCATPRGNASGNGTVLTLWTRDYSYGSPLALIRSDDGGPRIFTQFGGECITNYGGSSSNGTYLTLWSCAPDHPRGKYWYWGWSRVRRPRSGMAPVGRLLSEDRLSTGLAG
ncbi:hypothetical protein OG871_36440 [Kitasatospora sp. NBC_00374]|uniref:RICIN domain-containing protein n=1 Tax=Kitasatospora sp. NBC_00374 TaxID=2975964 RepID=UPI0030E2A4E5